MYRRLACTLCLLATPAFADMQSARDALQIGDFKTVVQELQNPIQSGTAEAEHLFGFLLENGHGIAQSPARAFDFYLRAATKGYPPAQKALSNAYSRGSGLAQPDPMRAYVWMKLAALANAQNSNAQAEQLRAKLSLQIQATAGQMIKDYHALFFPFDAN